MPSDMSPAHAEYCLRESDWFIRGALYSMPLLSGVTAWMSHPASVQQAESKIYQLPVARSLGFHIPDTLITNDAAEVRRFYQEKGGQIVAKPLRLGYFDYGQKKTSVYTNKVEWSDLHDDVSIKVAPVIYQELIPKLYDIRVTVVGNRLFAAAIHSQDVLSALIDWRRSDTNELAHTVHTLPPQVSDSCLRLVKLLGLNYGALDLVLTPKNEYVFLEINPNGQWAWLEDELNLPISEEIANWLFAQSKMDSI